VSAACTGCLRRGFLVTLLAPRVAGLLDPGRRPVPGLLALSDEHLIEALAGRDAEEVRARYGRFDRSAFEAELAAAGLHALCGHGPGFPDGLADLGDPPAALFSTAPDLAWVGESPAVAVVGTRRPSPYGLEMAQTLGRELAAAGIVVVSGLALGIDAAAHRGALEAGGRPLAVLAGGPDVPYPARHRRLYEQVRDAGAVISEMGPRRRAYRWSFPARNRIMAGIAGMTVVVEAADPSGSLITAEFAGQLGRPVGAVPGRATSRMAAGSNALLRDGARVVCGAGDVLEELLGPAAHAREAEPRKAPGDPPLRRLLDAVEGGHDLDAAASAAGLSAGDTRGALARLEAEGYLIRDGLGSYARAAGR
jgi:DNA processing protein